jgi:hypothetical protein
MERFSPKLKAAMKDIEKLLARYDIGASVCLMDGIGNSEFRLFIDTPSWSTIRFIKDKKGIHFKGYMESMPDETSKTVNMICCSSMVVGRMALNLMDIETTMRRQLDIEDID